MGRRQHDESSYSGLVGLQPVARGDTPAVAWHEARKVVFRDRCAEIVADHLLILEKLGAHHRADRVATDVLWTGAAATIAVEASQWLCATALERPAEDI